jgi:hypothetical protein
MFSIKSFSIAVLTFSAIFFSIYAAEPTSSVTTSNAGSDMWIPVDESDWAIYMDAPSYHFALAREYLQKGEYAKASSELKMGNSFLIFQEHRLSVASKQIEALSKSVLEGKGKDTSRFDVVTSNVFKVIDNKYTMLPIEFGATSVFEDAYKYHFDRALSKLLENDRAGSAAEIRRAGSFLKLLAAHTGNLAKADLNEVETELSNLASNVEAGVVKDKKELDQVFKKAMDVVSKKKK